MNYTDLMALPNEAIIYKITGRLVTLYEPKTGTNAKGDYSIQRGEIEIDGEKVAIFLKDREPVHKSWKNRDIIIEAHNGAKGWSGCYVNEDNYNGKNRREIKVTPTGIISLLGGAPAEPTEPPAQRQQAPTQPPAKTNQDPAPAAAAQPPPENGSRGAMEQVIELSNRVANLQILCCGRVESYVATMIQARTGRVLSDAERGSLCMNMLIELMRSGAVAKMPSTQFPPPKPAPPKTPTPQATDPASGDLFQ